MHAISGGRWSRLETYWFHLWVMRHWAS
jgi:hypothetical protein